MNVNIADLAWLSFISMRLMKTTSKSIRLDLYTIEIETNVFKMTFQKCVKTPSLQQHVSKSQGGQSTEQSELCGGK